MPQRSSRRRSCAPAREYRSLLRAESLCVSKAEHVYHVPPLDVPPPDRDSSDALQHSAVLLFIARIRGHSNFSPQEGSLSAIVAICQHLDGIPLAIEFAAARATTLGVQHVAARLNDRFSLLAGTRRTALPRHQTMR